MDWSALHPQMLPWVTGAPEPRINQALVKAGREFFRRTRAWREWLAVITTVDGQRQYTLTRPTGTEVVRLEAATLDGRPFAVLSAQVFEDNLALREGAVHGLVSEDRRTVQLVRAVAAGSALQLRASLLPLEGATGLPDAVMAHCGDDVAQGALADLLSQPNAPWRDPLEAKDRRGMFEVAIGCKSVEAYRGAVGGMPRARVKWC